jgi:hypothetical protein
MNKARQDNQAQRKRELRRVSESAIEQNPSLSLLLQIYPKEARRTYAEAQEKRTEQRVNQDLLIYSAACFFPYLVSCC